jgi:hypothetical protein
MESIYNFNSEEEPQKVDMVDEQSSPTNNSSSITLELGDIIEIISPSNKELHEITALITYIDPTKIKLINVATSKVYQLNITEEGMFTDESITQISLLSRSDEPGYARQNNLLPKTWVDIYFGGEIPVIITGEITNLEEDMIELTTYPQLHPIYINFDYKGIPENIPIDKIIIRQKPAALNKYGSLSMLRDQLEEGEEYEPYIEQQASMEFTQTGESIIHIPEGAKPDENVRAKLHDLYIDANSIVFGERLEEIVQRVEVPEEERRYGIDVQVNDLMDELLSTIPNSQRTKLVLDNIHRLIERFKELRSQFSNFDDNDNINGIKAVGEHYKPLVDKIHHVSANLRWLVPVVTNRKKLNDLDNSLETPDTIIEKSATSLSAIDTIQTDYYKNNTNNGLTYSDIQRQILNLINPVDMPLNTESNLITTNVMTNLDTIVDNLEDFYSTVYSKSKITKQQYVVQRYNLGSSRLKDKTLKSGKTVYIRSEMTPNDPISIKSVLMLPESVVKFSTIDLPSTNIMEKSTLHHNYLMLFRLLNKHADIIPQVIDDLSKEIEYEDEDIEIDKRQDNTKKPEKKGNEIKFLKDMQEFVLNSELYVDQDEKFQQFLEAIVPKTRFLIRSIRKHVKDKVSFFSVVQHLEPFMVYPNDITYKQYMEIRFFMKERISEFKRTFETKSREFAVLRNAKYIVNPKINPILRLLSENEKFAESFFNTYKFLSKDKMETKLSAQEIILKMIQLDNGNLYTNVMTSIMISLMTPNNLANILSASPDIDDTSEMEKIKPKDCTRRFLAKKYDSFKALQSDNNVDEIYFDEEFDDTPYDIIQKYTTQQKQMSPDLFLEFLTETLVHDHDCPRDIADELARTIISKKKLILDGHYAMLELKPKLPNMRTIGQDLSEDLSKEDESIELEGELRKKVQYFRRLKNNWVSDNSIDENTFIDDNTLFCNISKECFKNLTTKTCEPNEESRMKEIAKKQLIGEFDKRYALNIDELEKELDNNIAYYLKMLKKSQMLQQIQLYKYNNLAFEIGSSASKHELFGSPHMKLRDLILGQDDFAKKQDDICRFVEEYCRPMNADKNEDIGWFYCKDTNVKLFPQSIHELAQTFISGGDFVAKQNELCRRVGVLSDDGDSFVDKYSGFVIRKIDFSEEEGFNEAGFRVSTHEIMEQDIGMVVLEAIGKKEKRVFENELMETIYNVFSTVCNNIDIPVDGIDEFVMRFSNELIEKNVYSLATYQTKSDAQLKKTGSGFKMTYADYRNETIITIIACALLVAIQTVIPSFQTNRTFPGCVRSFSGYPMDGIEDLTGIKYIACVLNKSKSSVSPWNSIQKYSVDVLSKRIQTIIDKYVITRSDITDMFLKKREWMQLNPVLVAPEEHSIKKWRHFLPPLVQFSILSKIRNIGGDFEEELYSVMRQGGRDQSEMIAVLQSKILQYGYAIIESINNIVKNKDMLLKTSAQTPFLENACCNDKLNATNPLIYFNEDDNAISTFVHTTFNISNILKRIKRNSTAQMLYHPGFTGIRYPTIPPGQLEENIYAAVLWYCNFDRDLPIPEEYKVICNEKPALYKKDWSIMEKIDFLKRNGKAFNIDSLHQLMALVRRKNVVTPEMPFQYTQVNVFLSIIEKLDIMNSTTIAEPLRERIRALIAKYNPAKMVDVPIQELDDLTNYLSYANNELYKQIMEFFDRYGNLSDSEWKKLHEFLSKFEEWSLDKPMNQKTTYYDDGLYTVTQFIKNAIQNLAKFYPTILLNDASFYKKVAKHWGISSAHEEDIKKFIEKYYSEIEKFKGDAVLMRLLQEVSDRLLLLNTFTQNIPVFTEVVKEIVDEETGATKKISFHSLFEKSTLYMLFMNCFYSSIYEYILCSHDVNLLRADVQEFKSGRRARIKSNANESDSMITMNDVLEEELVDADLDLQEVRVVTGNTEELKSRVCLLLLSFLDIEVENKSAVDFSYEQIIKRVNRVKEKEKQGIIEYLGKMSIVERKIEDELKTYRIGRWNVGQQSGLVKYDKATYNREREELIQQLYEDVEGGEPGVVAEMRMDIYELEQLDKENAEAEIEDEMYNINGLGENYNDGEYYEEDLDDFHND